MKSWYAIKAAAPESDRIEISILSEIGYWGVNAIQFDRELKAKKGNATKATLTINSPGGDVFEGIAILHMLRNSGLEIEVKVLGVAASIASVIAMAGNTIVMPENTMMFVHNPISGVYGNAEDMRERAEDLDKVKQSINATYMSRFKGKTEDLDALLKRESYLTAAECLEHGFCDKVIPAVPMEAKFDIEQLPEAVRALFKPAVDPTPPAAATPLALRIAERVKAAGLGDFVAVFATADTFEAAEAAVVEALEIKALATTVGFDDQFAPLVRARKPLAEARVVLNDLRCKADAAAPVNNTQRPGATQPDTPTKFDANAIWAVVAEANKPNRSA